MRGKDNGGASTEVIQKMLLARIAPTMFILKIISIDFLEISDCLF